MMSRKDYVRAAEQVVRLRNTAKEEQVRYNDHLHTLAYVAGHVEDAFVSFFRGDNPRFDEVRFRAACGDAQKMRASANRRTWGFSWQG